MGLSIGFGVNLGDSAAKVICYAVWLRQVDYLWLALGVNYFVIHLARAHYWAIAFTFIL